MMLGVIYLNCSRDQSFENNRFLRRVVMGVGVEVTVGVVLFSIHLIREKAIFCQVTKTSRNGMESPYWISMVNLM